MIQQNQIARSYLVSRTITKTFGLAHCPARMLMLRARFCDFHRHVGNRVTIHTNGVPIKRFTRRVSKPSQLGKRSRFRVLLDRMAGSGRSRQAPP